MRAPRGFGAVALLACLSLSAPQARAQQDGTVPAEPAPTSEATPSQPAEAAERPPQASDHEAPASDTDATEPAGAQPAETPDETSVAPQRARLDPELEQRRRLRARLQDVTAELESKSTLWPWVAILSGAAILVTGVTAGSAHAIDCSGSCATPFWPGWAVTSGATIGIGGLVWLRLTEVGIEELDSQRYRLRRDLDRMELDAQ